MDDTNKLSEERVREGFRHTDLVSAFRNSTAWQVWRSAVCWAEAELRGSITGSAAGDLGECDECGTLYSFDPTDGGSICVRCLREKLDRFQKSGSAASGAADSKPSSADGGEARELHLEIVEQGFSTLLDSLMPSFEYVGVALRVSAEDHAAIRSAMAGARTSIQLLKNARAALATRHQAEEAEGGSK